MSLNGLDDPKVKEAYESTVAEPGGWFLLKYASRDDVELLGRGNGGIVEIRNNIAQYENENEDHSPLFGFLRYRRRNVIIKYLPEDCSRLVQARVTVHFNAVCERFTPYNTTFSIATAKELKDTKLSAACSLHAASGSTSSSTSSLRRRRLMEIAEEEEEEQRASKRKSLGDGLPETPGEESVETLKPPVAGPPVKLDADLANSPQESKFSESLEPPEFVGIRPPSPAKSLDEGRRMSSQSSRPDIYTSASYTLGKPRVMLAPRPSLDVAGHPRTAAVGAAFRPISQLPSGFKLFSKGAKKGKIRDNILDPSESTHPDETAETDLATTAIPLPDGDPISHMEEPVRPHTSSGQPRPTTSSGASIKSAMPSFTITAASTKQTITPEKARLMKAMQLREKKKKMSLQPPPDLIVDASVEAPPSEDVTSATTQPIERIEETNEQTLATDADADKADDGEGDDDGDGARRLSVSKADSGIVVDASSVSVHTDVASEITQSDSHPASPIVASSEADQSTKASSLSESTDETVKETQEDMLEGLAEDHSKYLLDTEPVMSETHEPAEPVPEPAAEPAMADIQDPPPDTQAKTVVSDVKELEESLPIDNEEKLSENMEEPAEDENKEIPFVAQETVEAPEAEEHLPETIDTSGLEQEVVEVVQPEQQAPEIEKAEGEEEECKDERPKFPISLPVSKFSTSPTHEKALGALSLEPTEEESKPEEETKAVSPAADKTSNSPRSPQSPGLKVPRSKFSTQDLRAAATAEVPVIVSSEDAASTQKPLSTTLEDHIDVDPQSAVSEGSKRRAHVDPIRTDFDESNKPIHADFSDDEGLMDELHSATVEQAQHVTVSKSPIAPAFSTPVKQDATSRPTSRGVVRTTSNPIRGSLFPPTDAAKHQSQRSISSGAAFLHKITQQQGSQNLAPKQPGKIGSSISQRIKALEKLSSIAPGTVDSDASQKSPRPSSAFFAVRGNVSRPPSRSPSLMERTSSLTRGTSPAPSVVVQDSRESSPETSKVNRGRSGSVAKRLSMFEAPGNQPPRGRPETISVIARIIRDPGQVGKAPETPKDPSEFARLNLKASPLVIDHQKAEPLPPANLAKVTHSKETIQERRLSKEQEKRRSQSLDPNADEDEAPRRSSLSIVRDFIKDKRKSLTSTSTEALTAPLPVSGSKSPSRPPSVHQTSSGFGRRLSISSRRSSISKENIASGAMSPSVVTEGSGSGDDSKSTTSDKKRSRASRFMRRLSSSLGSAGRSKTLTPTGISPTVKEEDALEVTRLQQPTIESFMGDVNVQFPDNLLWKRRSMCLDSQGFLILSTVAGSAAAIDKQALGAGVKRYHLSDFRTPYIPDVEVQELPNSVVLDFLEGSGLQVACEDRAGQLNILHILQVAHQTHSSFGQ